MSDAIGALKARVQLLQPTRVADEIGGVAIAWTDAGAVWAEINAGSAGQGADYDAAPSVAAFTARINRRADVRAGWRVQWGVRLLRITGIRDDGGARIDLICEEEVL